MGRVRDWWSDLPAGRRRALLCDLLGVAGLGLTSVGAALVYAPLGLLVPGVVFCVVAVLGARR